MLTTRRLLPLGLALASLLTGCAHAQLTENSLNDVHRLAVLVRAVPGPAVAVASAGENKAYPTLGAGESDARLKETLAKQVTVFEIEERLRATLMARVPETPPWSTAMPAAEVATVLQSLLVVDRTQPVDYEALRGAGADAVLELRVSEWGVRHEAGKTGLYLKGDGRLFRLPGKSGVWANTLDIDLAKDPQSEAVDVIALRNGGFREAIIGLLDKLSIRVASQLSAKP
ncbi:MAG TPA: hypothetical protein VGK67_26160 [Myxococcales bacterium]|jgi:hypothetical protein